MSSESLSQAMIRLAKPLILRDYCIDLQRQLGGEQPRHLIACELVEIVWPAMRRLGDAPVKPERLDDAAGPDGFSASIRDDEIWVERCVDVAIRTALDWCTANNDRGGHSIVARLLVRRAIEGARSSWDSGHGVIAHLVNDVLSEKNAERIIRADVPKMVGSLWSCRQQLAGFLETIPLFISQLPGSQADAWQPWTIALIDGPQNPPLLVGRLYRNVSDDDLGPAIQALRSKPVTWSWLDRVVQPIEHDAMAWAKRFKEMESRVDTFTRQVEDAVGKTEIGLSAESLEGPKEPRPTGFLGGTDLVVALGIHPDRREAFFQQLGRSRKELGDDCWREVSDRRPNEPHFLYRVDSTTLTKLAESYKQPKES